VVRIIIQRAARPDAPEPHAPPHWQPGGQPPALPPSYPGPRPYPDPRPSAGPQSYMGPQPGQYTQPLPPQYQAGRPRRVLRHFLPHIPWWVKWGAIIVVAGLIFRRAVAWLLLAALSAALHLFGVNWHLPDVKFGWPWQSISSGTTSTVVVGPIVLQKIEGISRPALGTENFNFVFTHTVTKNIAFWPCWYSATFYAVGRASATVDLNPGPAWWRSSTGHYQLRVLRKPVPGSPGALAISMALPLPQLPQSVHDISVDNTLSKPLSTSHSWTYPGLGCGVLIQPQFAQSVLYAQAQSTAFYQATHLASVTRPLVAAAETEAVQLIRNNFIQPTVNALGYTLTQFTIRWVSP